MSINIGGGELKELKPRILVLVVGLAFVLRDVVQRELGSTYALGAILVGAVLSGLVAPATLVFASIAAFAISELAEEYSFILKNAKIKDWSNLEI